MRSSLVLFIIGLLLFSCNHQKPENDKTLVQNSENINEVESHELVQIETDHGNILLYLHPETPIHKKAFLDLVNEGYFNGQSFNRVIDGFVIQGGCPDPSDYSNGGLWEDTSMFIPAEFHEHLKHKPGALGGGRDNNTKMMTNPCQFYICDSTDRDLSRLDMKYTIFGFVIEGMDVVQLISELSTDKHNAPIEPVTMNASVVVLSESELNQYFEKLDRQ